MGKMWSWFWKMNLVFLFIAIGGAVVFLLLNTFKPDFDQLHEHVVITVFLVALGLIFTVASVALLRGLWRKAVPIAKNLLSHLFLACAHLIIAICRGVIHMLSSFRSRAATRQLKRIKYLLDTGVIDQNEFDSRRDELRPVILKQRR